MTRRLILMRHAKSSWANPGQPDHARPLNGRGRDSAVALGDWLRGRGYLPEQALVSSARRTRDTFAGLALPVTPVLDDGLYHAGSLRMLATLRAARGQTVLMIGHNPGIAEFAEVIVQAPPGHGRFADYPTGATLVADFPISAWDQIRPGMASAVDFIIPRELRR
ncbi:MAG: histidine phosphatase family protein [Rhodobacteraceae bacterium]|nr:histidine phosphatase family protein [Paracoccaceae bacterium]MBR9823085.1 histidine phosphatase family protein [Paracoccaceae bacterium]